ncbi:7-cyano-7-deazaguanine synthase [Pelagibacterium luteolum]|uniref:Queuosine biosynthesis protein QueC n=1 Tax=Pelagibacterium luteolum TaxID=440168 RepID=A0A1G7Y2I4_9HYPH|nr:7-cyano-7-deazaguanine synthase [Pelagibacterium luteolum]SDG90651.1 Queuosine biosynthesis protein QueC [Pelagibacterium luteolum]
MNVHNHSSPTTKTLVVLESGERPPARLHGREELAEIGQQIRFDAGILDSFDVAGCLSRHFDLLVVCAAIELADRRWGRPRAWSRNFNLRIPVIDLERWQKPAVAHGLRRALGFLTGDNWQFTFVRAKNGSPIGMRQIPLGFDKTKKFAIAYSDGLDSRAVTSLSGGEDEALCIRVAGTHQRRQKGDSPFERIPFDTRDYRQNESSFRSRSFKFAAITAMAAQLYQVSRIVVPESGQGALGPAILPLHNIYADYRNHPAFFRRMEQFLHALLDWSVKFEQPRLWYTKGQTLRDFRLLPGKTNLDLTQTHSCWQTRRIVNDGYRRQCGLCAACLLRRQSLHAAGIKEDSGTYVVRDLNEASIAAALTTAVADKADRDIMIAYGSAGARHLQHLADLADQPDKTLHTHASQIAIATGETCDETTRRLSVMLSVHAEEWRAFRSDLGGNSFLNSWMDGGRNG